MIEPSAVPRHRRPLEAGLPVFYALLALWSGYSLFDGWWIRQDGVWPLDPNLVRWVFPVLLATALVRFVLRPHLAFLRLDTRFRWPLFVELATIAVLAVPTIVAQPTVQARTGRLLPIARSSELDAAPAARYYTVPTLCLAYRRMRDYTALRAIPTALHRLEIDVYIVVPVCPAGAGGPTGRTFLARHVTGEVGDSAPAERDREVEAFTARARRQVADEDPASYPYLERLAPSPERTRFERALPDDAARSPAVRLLVPGSTPFDARPGLSWRPTGLALVLGFPLWLALLLLVPPRTGLSPANAGAAETTWPLQSVWGLLRPTARDYGLALLLNLNLAVTVAMVATGAGLFQVDTAELLAWGANYAPALHGSGWLRLVTSQFVHGGLVHLLGNLAGLVFAAGFLAPVLSNARLVGAYLVAGLGGAATSAWAHPATLSAGASGAIFGLYGLLLVLLALGDPRVAEGRRFIFVNVALFVGCNLLLGELVPGLDNAAHVGGLLTGLGLGALVARRPA